MADYICTKCGFKSDKLEKCPKCDLMMQKMCPICGLAEELCTCTESIPQTKGTAKTV